MPEAEFNVTYYKSVPLIPDATIKQAFQQASSVPFSLIVDDELADNEEAVDLSAEDFVDKLWLLSIMLLLIMISGENLIEYGRLEKKRKPKSGDGSRRSSGHRISWVGSTNRQLQAKPEIAESRLNGCLASRAHQAPAAWTSSTR